MITKDLLTIRPITRKPAEKLIFYFPPFTPIYTMLITFTDNFVSYVDSSYL